MVHMWGMMIAPSRWAFTLLSTPDLKITRKCAVRYNTEWLIEKNGYLSLNRPGFVGGSNS